jgi:hypothetical protein
LSIHAYYDKFYLPEGAKFFVYSEKTEQSEVITSEFLGSSFENPRKFATGLIYGETIVFEYWQPASVHGNAVIEISRLDYGYRDVRNDFDELQNMTLNLSLDCNIDINCWQGGGWQNWKRAVARIIINGPEGSFGCTGALINNTRNDFTPFFLTANHCLAGEDAISHPDASRWIFLWNYERPNCNNGTATSIQTVGATVVANNRPVLNFALDFALLRLTDNPINIQGINPYFLGWDRSSYAPSRGYGIHHPRGDVKKISLTNDISKRPILNQWRVVWSEGITENGSSGSPLVNSAGRLIGQLSWSLFQTCNWVPPGFDGNNYGRFDVSWTGDGASDPRRRLRDWLDPLGTNPMALNSLAPRIMGSNTICTQEVYQIINLPNAATVTWNSTPNITRLSSNNNTVNVQRNTAIATGIGWISATLSLPQNPNFITLTKDIHVGPPNRTLISSIYNQGNTPQFTPFEDVITYNGEVPAPGNIYGIFAGEWREIPFGGVHKYALFAPPGNGVSGTNAILHATFTGISTTTAQIEARLQNQCGWSSPWATIAYLNPTSGGGTDPGDPGDPGCSFCNGICPACCPNCLFGCFVCGGFIFSPNPVDNELTIEFKHLPTRGNSSETYSVKLIDNLGVVHRETTFRHQQGNSRINPVKFNVFNLREGTYYLHIEGNGEIHKEQIVVKRK